MLTVEERRNGRLRRFLERHDVFYAVPVAIAVAAFILAILVYFAGQ